MTSMLRVSFGALLATAFICSNAAAQKRQIIERVIATVNDEALFLSDLRRKAIPFLPQVMDASTTTERQSRMEQLYAQLLERLIDEEILLQTAADMRLRASREEVDRAIENLRSQSGLEEDAFWELVESQGMTRAQYREDMRRQVLQYKVINQRVRAKVQVSEADIRQKYEEEQARNERVVEYELAHIFIPLPGSGSESPQQTLSRLRAKLTPDDFLTQAENVGGGDLGWIKKGDLPESLDDAIGAMAVNEISQPVTSPSGVHLLWLKDKREGGARSESYEEARARIQAKLTETVMVEQQQVVLSQLRNRAVVKKKL